MRFHADIRFGYPHICAFISQMISIGFHADMRNPHSVFGSLNRPRNRIHVVFPHIST